MNYNWQLENLPKKAHNTQVFTTFACGGGSSMGYKLSGYDVVAANDIDVNMSKIYKKNLHPKNYFLCDIRDLTKQEGIEKFIGIDVLDGSPPCSVFSMAGSREKGWGKEKMFKEGQKLQTLDDLFFRFLDLAKFLKPKFIISENVKGMVLGDAKKYAKNVMLGLNEMGYTAQIFLLNSAFMGVPQRRERVFIVAHRKEYDLPKLKLEFNEKPILFGEYRSEKGKNPSPHFSSVLRYTTEKDKCVADVVKRINGKNSGFNAMIVKDDHVYPTITATGDNFRYFDKKACSDSDYILSSTFPTDYDFLGQKVKYVVGMSVPPLMMAKVSEQIYLQWISKI